jgi:hypothetical protein
MNEFRVDGQKTRALDLLLFARKADSSSCVTHDTICVDFIEDASAITFDAWHVLLLLISIYSTCA